MNVSTPSPSPWLHAFESLPPMITWITTTCLALIALVLLTDLTKRSAIPLANAPKRFQLARTAQLDFLKHTKSILAQCRKFYKGKPYRLLTEVGEVVVLPPALAHDIRNVESLSFSKAITSDFHTNIPGFEPFGVVGHDGKIMQAVTRKQLTKHLNTVTEPLSSEATFATALIFGNSQEWQEVRIRELFLDLISRLSSRVFLGEEICRRADWLDITKSYTVDGFKAADALRRIPWFLRFPVSCISAECKRVRQEVDRAREIITPVITQRRALKAQAQAEGKSMPTFNDAIEWAETESRGQAYDQAIFQLSLSTAAIHTTTGLLTQTMLLLSRNPELIEPLRKEIVSVLQAEGWTKTALYQMKLLDSCIKEVHRLYSTSTVSMRRLVEKDVVLPNGTTLRKGQRLMVDNYGGHDDAFYTDPENFDIYRFVRMREEPGSANKAQLVTTSPEHLAFGHGMHACPGRFFAANEVKIALCHLLLKYDWKLVPGVSVDLLVSGTFSAVNPQARVMFRRREEEIDLESVRFV